MQSIVKQFLEIAIKHFAVPEPIYEIGSYQVAGQEGYADLRPYFPGKKYVGCDMRMGPGVDQIEDVESLSLASGSVGSLITVDTLEHVKNPFNAIREIYRVLQDGGILLLAVPFNFQIHDYPSDYWRYTPSCVDMLLENFSFCTVLWEKHPLEVDPAEVYAVAVKNSEPPLANIQSFIDEVRGRYGFAVRSQNLNITG
ncbi:methyltransferase domain-containing protein [Effusibacillus lacus]|uniref:Methyltransferase type 11 domain-containing protein n=1 Tax=Effusibacillus lacus TaxID=1348429 RepID=A0A292YS31_9BACL|nr:methyltransferase domain-containing protein [Effusibacillus lacus]TCS73518.1 methyltransferase family protein [Effusibacillus lacus]GAX91986.1 hypothetical protein EFBL_3677 [Effusibacillus lacus]